MRRDQLLVTLGWASALRANELVGLDVDDLTVPATPPSATAASSFASATARARQFLWMLIGDPLDAALLGSTRPTVPAHTSAQQVVRLVLAAHGGARRRER